MPVCEVVLVQVWEAVLGLVHTACCSTLKLDSSDKGVTHECEARHDAQHTSEPTHTVSGTVRARYSTTKDVTGQPWNDTPTSLCGTYFGRGYGGCL